MAEKSRYFYEDVILTDELKQQYISPDIIPIIATIAKEFARINRLEQRSHT